MAAMTKRKGRAKKFLADLTTPFTLLFCLCLHSLLERPVKVCFQLYDADKKALNVPAVSSGSSKNTFRRRCKGKQKQMLQDPEICLTEASTVADLKVIAQSVTKYIWATFTQPLECSRFVVPTVFWPESRSEDEMFKTMTSAMLKAASGIKFRIFNRFAAAPYVLLPMVAEGSSAETRRIMTEKFLSMKQCCLDALWGRPVQLRIQKELDDAGEDAAACMLAGLVHKVAKECRGVSLREENLHALQKKFAGGWRAKARPFVQQCAQTVLAISAKNHAACRLYSKVPSQMKAWHQKKAVVRKNVIKHPRPKQFGRPVFTYVATRLQQGSQLTRQQLRNEWQSLSDADKELWTHRHKSQVAQRRHAKQVRDKAVAEEESQRALKTPWGLGDKQWPLTGKRLQEFLGPFSRCDTGLETLRAASQKRPAAEQYIRNVENKEIKYHGRDAATHLAKTCFGEPVDAANDVARTTWTQIAGCTVEAAACHEDHPGLCRMDDSGSIEAARILAQHLPREDAVLRFDKGKVSYFFRLVIGAGG